MKTFFKGIFEYHNYMNQKLIDLFLMHSDKISELSLILFSHSINAHQIWNARILKTDPVGVNDVHSLEKCQSMDDENFRNTIRITQEYNFDDKIEYQNSKGDWYINTIQDILFQIANHFTHHKGQIMADLRQSGIEPFITDYIYYKRSV